VQRRVPILAKLLLAYLIPTAAAFGGFGLVAHWVARRALEDELGRRLEQVASAVAAQVTDESVALLGKGDEKTRTYLNLARRLQTLRSATGLGRVFIFAKDGTARVDADQTLPIGEPYFRLSTDGAEVRTAFAGTPSSSVLFRGRDGALYKSGYAAILDDNGHPTEFAVGVEGAASLYAQLAGFRRSLVGVGLGAALLVVLLSVWVARLLVRPVKQLEEAAARIGSGDLDAIVAVPSRDEIGRVAETLEKMRLALRERDERLQMMLHGIAHEVRNPLGGMQLYAGLLRDELTDAESLGHVHRIERELGHLKTIVSDFLEYARRTRPQLATHDLAELCGEIKELCLASAAERGVALQLGSTPVLVACDRGQLRRALLNLVQNAVQAAPSGTGVVRIDCSEHAVTVVDNGPGIAPELVEKIWTPFYTTKQSGTGLGLAFVRDIARDHGARLDVDSRPGHTTFRITFAPTEAS